MKKITLIISIALIAILSMTGIMSAADHCGAGGWAWGSPSHGFSSDGSYAWASSWVNAHNPGGMHSSFDNELYTSVYAEVQQGGWEPYFIYNRTYDSDLSAVFGEVYNITGCRILRHNGKAECKHCGPPLWQDVVTPIP